MANVETGIRLARPTDCVALAELSRTCIEQGLRWRWKPSRLLSLIRSPEATVITAGPEGQPDGFAAMEFHAVHAHLNLLAVREGKRRERLGANLLNWLEESARIAGLNFIALEVRRDNEGAIKFYQQAGYRLQKIKAGYYDGRVDALAMAHQLIDADTAARRPN